MALDPADLKAVTEALGREPVDALDVVARRSDGKPAVITTYALREQDGQMAPFPTFYWLVCPDLNAQIAELERRGIIDEIEDRLQAAPELMAAYHNDHRRYLARRLEALPPIDRIRAGDLKSVGIAGIADWNRVKCLHAQYAHHLADENTVGKLLEAEFGVSLS